MTDLEAAAPILRRSRPEDFPAVLEVDDDASKLYESASIVFDLDASHPFVIDEQSRWRRSVEAGRTVVAVLPPGEIVGFAAVDLLDGAPYLDQLSVRPSATRRRIGRRLLHESFALARELGGNEIWLTTYAHLPWNRPFYEGAGFVVVPEHECGSGVRHHLERQRAALPFPEERVAMWRPLE